MVLTVQLVTMTSAAAQGWSVVTSPNPSSSYDLLNSVSCSDDNDCTAVGSYFDATSNYYETLIETLDDGSWAVVASPNVSGSNNYLNAVSCSADDACTAVGYSYNTTTNSQTLIETLNDGTWSVVASPDPSSGSEQSNVLNSVSCSATASCTAVGYYFNPLTDSNQTLIETPDDGTWSVVASPNVYGANNVGWYNVLNSVSCADTATCTAVGYYDYNSDSPYYQTLIETLDDGTWSVVASPNPSNSANILKSVSCSSDDACTAVGHYFITTEAGTPPAPYLVPQTLIESVSDGTWSVVNSPDPNSSPGGGSSLYSVSCAGPTACTAVGEYSSTMDFTLIEAADDASWSTVTSQTEGTGAVLDSVSCTSDGSCFGVGYYFGSSSSTATLIETNESSEEPPSETPEAPFALGMPLAAGAVVGAYCLTRRSRRSHT